MDDWHDVQGAAALAHEVNRAYCRAIGDDSQKPWKQASPAQRASAIKGIEALIESPDMTPEDLHESWFEEKLAQGWKWGSVKDEEEKTHPCMMEYKHLPEAQRVKDHLFRAAVVTYLGLE